MFSGIYMCLVVTWKLTKIPFSTAVQLVGTTEWLPISGHKRARPRQTEKTHTHKSHSTDQLKDREMSQDQ